MKYENFNACKEIVEQIDRHKKLLDELQAISNWVAKYPTDKFTARVEIAHFHVLIPSRYSDQSKIYIDTLIEIISKEIEMFTNHLSLL